MSPGQVIDDPVLGRLQLAETAGAAHFFDGRVNLTPKHPVGILFWWDREGGTLEEGLARAREAYQRVRQNEWGYRQAAAKALFPEFEDYISHEATVEEVAWLLTLTSITLHSTDLGCLLYYDSEGEYSRAAIRVEFSEAGEVLSYEL